MNASAKLPVALKKRKLSFKQQQLPNTALGQAGENQAVHFLTQHHCKILHRNVVLDSVEVDIIALDIFANELIFCEVKTRTTQYFGHPSLAVSRLKIRKMRRAALTYLSMYGSTTRIRIDSIAVLPDGITHYKNITI